MAHKIYIAYLMPCIAYLMPTLSYCKSTNNCSLNLLLLKVVYLYQDQDYNSSENQGS